MCNSLQNNKLGDVGVRYLASALGNNTTLTSLDLRQVSMSSVGVQHLCDALASNKHLASLEYVSCIVNGASMQGTDRCWSFWVVGSIGSNHIGAVGAKALAALLSNNSSLKSLR